MTIQFASNFIRATGFCLSQNNTILVSCSLLSIFPLNLILDKQPTKTTRSRILSLINKQIQVEA